MTDYAVTLTADLDTPMSEDRAANLVDRLARVGGTGAAVGFGDNEVEATFTVEAFDRPAAESAARQMWVDASAPGVPNTVTAQTYDELEAELA